MQPAMVSVVLPFNASLNSSCAHPPQATAEHLSSCLVSPGGRALANFALPGDQAFALNPEVTGCVIMTIR